MQLLDDLLQHSPAHADGWTPRDIDTALYWTGTTPGPVGRTRGLAAAGSGPLEVAHQWDWSGNAP